LVEGRPTVVGVADARCHRQGDGAVHELLHFASIYN
jgi:hypothetical protein